MISLLFWGNNCTEKYKTSMYTREWPKHARVGKYPRTYLPFSWNIFLPGCQLLYQIHNVWILGVNICCPRNFNFHVAVTLCISVKASFQSFKHHTTVYPRTVACGFFLNIERLRSFAIAHSILGAFY